MDNKQILEKALQKAIDGGWWNQVKSVVWHDWYEPYELVDVRFKDGSIGEGMNIEAIIFNHDFARALWGENTLVHPIPVGMDTMSGSKPDHPLWQYHLQQMVVSNDPIKYLGENV